jgi:acyl-coenzyme A thioesterase PaaI-like protein
MDLVTARAFQDQIPNNYCWGCGADNPAGLHLKSYWNEGIAIAQWTPSDDFAAGPRHFLNGGIIATLLDCHGVCTAVADAYQREGREIGTDPEIWHATASLSVEYLRPTPIKSVLQLRARVITSEDGSTSVECALAAGGKDRAQAAVRTVGVPDEWRHGSTDSPG